MKSAKRIACAAVIGGIAAVGLSGGPAQAAKTLKYTSFLPPKQAINVGGADRLIEVVEKKTNGSVRFETFYGGSLLGARNTATGLRDGVADGGVVAWNYTPAEFPHIAIAGDLSMLANNGLEMSAAMTEYTLLHCPGCLDDMKKMKLVQLATGSNSSYKLLSRTPIRSVEDLKGKKMRAAGGAFVRWAGHVGGTAVNVPSSDIFSGLNTGNLDLAILNVTGMQSYDLWDVVKHITLLDLGTFNTVGVAVLNADVWKGLTTAERQAFIDGAAEGVINMTAVYLAQDNEVLEKARAQGVNVYQPSAELKAQRDAFLDQDLPEVRDIAVKAHKVADPDPYIQAFRELVKKWTKLYEGKENDPDAMVALLKKEVYSKVDPATFGM